MIYFWMDGPVCRRRGETGSVLTLAYDKTPWLCQPPSMQHNRHITAWSKYVGSCMARRQTWEIQYLFLRYSKGLPRQLNNEGQGNTNTFNSILHLICFWQPGRQRLNQSLYSGNWKLSGFFCVSGGTHWFLLSFGRWRGQRCRHYDGRRGRVHRLAGVIWRPGSCCCEKTGTGKKWVTELSFHMI